MTWYETWQAARDEWTTARVAHEAITDEAVGAEYARLRDEDRAAGRPTGPGSVARRRRFALDTVIQDPETRARGARVDALYEAYQAAQPR